MLCRDLLDRAYDEINPQVFITQDPLNFLHRFTRKQDVEIMALLISTIAWGNRKAILSSGEKLLAILEYEPYDFISNVTLQDLQYLENISIHRTFSGKDLKVFILFLSKFYENYISLETLFIPKKGEVDLFPSIQRFRNYFLASTDNCKSARHISQPDKNSASKRILLMLRWLVRKDSKNIDLGLWENIEPKFLSLPLDVHSSRKCRELGLLRRKVNDRKAVEEVSNVLKILSPEDPIRYDIPLFYLEISEKNLE